MPKTIPARGRRVRVRSVHALPDKQKAAVDRAADTRIESCSGFAFRDSYVRRFAFAEGRFSAAEGAAAILKAFEGEN